MTRRAVVAMASMASGGVALFAIAWLAARRLTGAELGFFFSFLSFGALMQLADFGLSYAALQSAGQLAGTGRLHELPALARRVALWNFIAASVATLGVAAIGVATFSSRRAESGGVDWMQPWALYLLAMFAQQLTMPRLALREGSGRVEQVWRLRLVQEWIAGGACALALYFGWGLWSLAPFAALRALIAAVWLGFLEPLPSQASTDFSLERWMVEVWPFQWRIGLSVLAGFLLFRAFAPIILIEQGPVAAGQFGLAIAMMNLLIAVTTAWPNSQAARYAALNAAGKFEEVRREFPSLLWPSSALALAACLAAAAMLWKLRVYGVTIAMKLPDPRTTFLVIMTAVVHHVVLCFAVFLRSEGREPLLIPSIAGSIASIATIWLTARYGTLQQVAAVNLAWTLVGIPIVLFLFRSRLRYHRSAS